MTVASHEGISITPYSNHVITIPDKYVIVGAHIDSWIQGAVDSGTGYTIMQELSRTFAYHIGKGIYESILYLAVYTKRLNSNIVFI